MDHKSDKDVYGEKCLFSSTLKTRNYSLKLDWISWIWMWNNVLFVYTYMYTKSSVGRRNIHILKIRKICRKALPYPLSLFYLFNVFFFGRDSLLDGIMNILWMRSWDSTYRIAENFAPWNGYLIPIAKP